MLHSLRVHRRKPGRYRSQSAGQSKVRYRCQKRRTNYPSLRAHDGRPSTQIVCLDASGHRSRLRLFLTCQFLNKMECWSPGVLEYWVLNASLHYSITPVLQSSVPHSGSANVGSTPPRTQSWPFSTLYLYWYSPRGGGPEAWEPSS